MQVLGLVVLLSAASPCTPRASPKLHTGVSPRTLVFDHRIYGLVRARWNAFGLGLEQKLIPGRPFWDREMNVLAVQDVGVGRLHATHYTL